MTHLTVEGALEYISGICFKTGPPSRVGVELEWFPRDARRPEHLPERERLMRAFADAADQPLSGSLTMEPGGQWELSSSPADTVRDLIAATDRDLTLLRRSAAEAGLELVGTGREHGHPPSRVIDHPRYVAMEHFFDRDNGSGRVMMCSTASIQVNLDAGTEHDGPEGFRRRWRLAHQLTPVLTAVFCRTDRPAVWAAIDPGRTAAPPLESPDLRLAYAQYALDAKLMCVQRPDGAPWTAPQGLTFREWIKTGALEPGEDRAPTLDDLAYHLTTLFPPVRPRGHLEFRVLDALPGDLWRVPTALLTALFHDARATDDAQAALELTPIRKAAAACFDAALSALERMDVPAELTAEVARYAEEDLP
ncbi:glutamate-cysteine ligase family protein [Catenulispora rubra]|uniref:glutamate-cysteine ligase family protein n=1 Tax=Catenulispora rubra TaxID=280293 RepID=UPI0018923D58|nr:glutamate-cysteine ligase family protein [Catenulispora rubra]